MTMPTPATSRVAVKAKITMAAYLTASSRVRPAGMVEQVAQRAQVGLAGHGVRGDRGHREGQEQRQLQGQRGEGHEQAVAGDLTGEIRSAALAGREENLTAMAMKIGTAASTTIPAKLRRRPKMSISSERRNARRLDGPGPPAAGCAALS